MPVDIKPGLPDFPVNFPIKNFHDPCGFHGLPLLPVGQKGERSPIIFLRPHPDFFKKSLETRVKPPFQHILVRDTIGLHPVGREIDAVPPGIAFQIAKNVCQLEGLSQRIGIRSQFPDLAAKNRYAGTTDGTGGQVTIASERFDIRNPDRAEICLHAVKNVPEKGQRDAPAMDKIPKILSERVGKGLRKGFSGKELSPQQEPLFRKRLVRGFVDDIVNNPAKQVKRRQVLPGCRIKKEEGHGKGAFPNSLSGLFKSVQIQNRAVGRKGLSDDPVILGKFCPDIHYPRMLA